MSANCPEIEPGFLTFMLKIEAPWTGHFKVYMLAASLARDLESPQQPPFLKNPLLGW